MGGTLSWRWYTSATGEIRTHDFAIASPAPYNVVSFAALCSLCVPKIIKNFVDAFMYLLQAKM